MEYDRLKACILDGKSAVFGLFSHSLYFQKWKRSSHYILSTKIAIGLVIFKIKIKRIDSCQSTLKNKNEMVVFLVLST